MAAPPRFSDFFLPSPCASFGGAPVCIAARSAVSRFGMEGQLAPCHEALGAPYGLTQRLGVHALGSGVGLMKRGPLRVREKFLGRLPVPGEPLRGLPRDLTGAPCQWMPEMSARRRAPSTCSNGQL